jgi:HlyD family secretion protein
MIFILSVLGVLAGLVNAYIYAIEKPPLPPLFNPTVNPYDKGLYVNGIVESDQSNGENINIYPEVSGTVTEILAAEGADVKKGTPLFRIENSVQSATVAQMESQAEAAHAQLDELKAQPRKENLDISRAQVVAATATLKNARDQYEKQKSSYDLDPNSVSKDSLDSAENAFKIAEANLVVAQRQYDLTLAGAWEYDIRNQEKQVNALTKAYQASNSLLAKYTVRAPADGVVMALNIAIGGYTSPQGTYEPYTQGYVPAVVMGSPANRIGVRCYIDEILINRMPDPSRITARMTIRGTDIHIPLTFVRIQPYVSPKIELSNQRNEKVDLRVLPVLFRFDKPANVALFPGQLVDVYIGEK